MGGGEQGPGEFVLNDLIFCDVTANSAHRKQHLSVIDQIDHDHILSTGDENSYSRTCCRMDKGRYQMLPSG